MMNRMIAGVFVLVAFGVCVAQGEDIRRISLEGKEGVPAPWPSLARMASTVSTRSRRRRWSFF